MILLTSTSDKIRLTTSGAVTTDVHASSVDYNGTTVTPGRQNTAITTATTTDVVGSPGTSTQRNVKSLHIRNKHATTSQTVTVIHTDGTTACELVSVTLPAGYTLAFDEGAGFRVLDSYGRVQGNTSAIGTAAVNAFNFVVLSGDVVNNNATPNTMQDVTALSFAVVAGETYYFEFVIPYTSAATTTGSRWSINGPGSPTLLNYRSEYTLAATTTTINSATAYDIPAASNATSLTAGNVATIWGVIKPSGNGTVIARFASEIANSAITAKAGAFLRWVRVI